MGEKRRFMTAIGFCLIILTFILASTSAYAQKPVTFNVNLTTPEQINRPMKQFAKAIEERTGGKVKLNLYYSNSLLAVPDILTGLQTGVADISSVVASNYAGTLPLNDMIGWPFMGYPRWENAFDIHMKLLKDVPEVKAEFSNLGLRVFAGVAMAPQQLLVASKRKVYSPDDIKGMKIISIKPVPAAIIRKWGGTPVAIGIADYYMSLERGVADAVTIHIPAALNFGLIPLTKQYVAFGEQGFFVETLNYVISDNAWNKLTPESQAIFMEEAANLNAGELANMRGLIGAGTGMLKKHSEFTVLTPEQIAAFSQDASKVHQESIDKLEKQGKRAQKVYDAIKKQIAKMK